MSNPTLESVAERLDGLERQNVRLRRIAAGLALVAIVAAIEAWVGNTRRPGTIEAERVVIRDRDGRVRAKLGVEGPDTSLVMYDHRGSEQLNLGVAGTDLSSLTFSDAGQNRVMLQAASDGTASLQFRDRNEKSSALWFMGRDSSTGLMFSNSKHGVAMGVDPAGRSAVFSTDELGNENGRLGATAVTVESLGIFGAPRPVVSTEVTSHQTEPSHTLVPMPMPVNKTEVSPDCDIPRSGYRGAPN